CNPATGACSSPAKPDGSACTDGNACTRSDTCQSGVCAGGNSVVCPAPDQCNDAGSCNPASRARSSPATPDGSACTDGNACTRPDTCQTGVCTGRNPVSSPPSHYSTLSRSCNPATGACSSPAKPDGSACTDGNACTRADTCQTGVCTGGNSVVCAAP